jgi:peptide deformylase
MAVLPIVTGADNPILRTKTERVPKVTKEVQKLLKDMIETTKDASGAGLAAPQIASNLRVCIVLINGRFIPLVNPTITWKSEDTVTDEEGCLSLPNTWVMVPRAREIRLTYTDTEGVEQERLLSDFDARVVQHEVDHLEGVLIVDYAKPHKEPTGTHVPAEAMGEL